jgi:hypothetical protein
MSSASSGVGVVPSGTFDSVIAAQSFPIWAICHGFELLFARVGAFTATKEHMAAAKAVRVSEFAERM